ncbi:glutamate synthase large subunit [Clostridium aminobutyricum]|uniref:Glutamate synthase large subunit n=1 Tax=Clostridium aminobutyricum TaxID=33953 RepID=A0A939D964_CLOAM|nr:glutamate synthase large subunit [Clostridium aminobutyricum]MBN7773506.1 glutamate synthase large subunit [Clostridium aminobutyricum]
MSQTDQENPKMIGSLYDKNFEHDNCGIGAIVNIKGIKTHKTVYDALTIVERLEHRAGKDATGEMGDGVGILTQIPRDFFIKNVKNIEFSSSGDFGVGMFFLPQDELLRNQAKKRFEVIVEKEGLKFLGWREVPTANKVLGKQALNCKPAIYQGFVDKPRNLKSGIDFDRKLYVIRRIFENSNDNENNSTYVCSLSSRTIVYKGMFLVNQLRLFYKDLQDQDFISAIAIVHSRFSTNTMPSWEKSHPNRYIVHNGEINTIRGNVNKMLSREENMSSDILGEDFYKVLPVVPTWGSDSAMLDNTLEFMVMSGIDFPKAVMMCIPEPWCNDRTMSQKKKDFYIYHGTMMEPWDGPASIVFSDGDLVGAVLDRNGLRPSRYYVTKDENLILSSEVGVLEIAPEEVEMKGRVHPGKMLLIDTKAGKIIKDKELKEYYSGKQPYGEWLENNLIHLKELHIPNQKVPFYKGEQLARLQKTFGYSYEDVKNYLLPMALDEAEPTIAMGADTPLAALSQAHTPLFDYFKQLFAQVTNPPIDAIREEIITSTYSYLGKDGNILKDSHQNCRLLSVRNPILTNTDFMKIKNMKAEGFKVATVPITYYKGSSLEKALNNLFIQTDRAFKDGANIIILSDRDVDEYRVPIPSLLAVSAVQQYLVNTRKRMSLSLILESGEPREVHHFATLLGYGASAINPYLAQDTIKQMIEEDLLEKDYYAAVDDYTNGILHGIIKIASKMGISTIQSYQGAQIFEAVGVSKDVIDKYFTNTVSRVGGITLKDIEEEVDVRHSAAFDPLGLNQDLNLESMGSHKVRSGKEEHLYNPKTIHTLQVATRTGDYQLFKEYTRMVNEELGPSHLRALMDFNYKNNPIPIGQVESVESIVKRFKTGAMSYGSISQEAHETMAIAMNKLQGKSNSGEGGEAPRRFTIGADGKNLCSAIKQVASGRFGVTSEYLVSAKEIQIKIAQGAKPGEGGQLPGDKVYPWIAKTRHSTTGVGLISPPPHHDIYSIEDLAQLIYDCKCANSDARISVKLVSEAGVGTIAAGVAKAGAQVILVSGYDGGTGAAPKNSVYHAGLPWELGLAEAHQTLLMNGLRKSVVLETDGKLMSGREVAIAALLGAEEFGFATAPLVTMGCVMMRVCNLDTCPVGIATQNPKLRKRFAGKPEYVINFMQFIAEELREYMAKLGFRTIDEMVGRTDMLKAKVGLNLKKYHRLDIAKIWENGIPQDKLNCIHVAENTYDFKLNKTKDMTVLYERLKESIAKGEPKTIQVEVDNQDRTFGTILGSMLTRKFGQSLEQDTYRIQSRGYGGQSFGAFIPKGLTLELEGDSNDYLGKGLSGGIIIVYPNKKSTFKHDENMIIGNVALYGATSGKAFISGVAGERFCVRNSGADAVVEGVGDHGLEYMTGGRVVILGTTGNNLAAGMSGGFAYVLDKNGDLYSKLNKEVISLESVSKSEDVLELNELIKEHVFATNSIKGTHILNNFTEYLPKFKKIIPYDYKNMLSLIRKYEEIGVSEEQALVKAFYESKGGEQEWA